MTSDPIPSAAMRSRIVLEIASELVTAPDQPMRQAKVLLRERGTGADWPIRLYGSSTIDGIQEVVSGETMLAVINPSTMLSLALKGSGPFATPQPVRAIAVMPSEDQLVFAVRPETGLNSLEEIAARKPALRLGLRGQPEHSLHFVLRDILQAAGLALDDLTTWGGSIRKDGSVPRKDSRKFQDLVSGALDVVFDEGTGIWLSDALAAGLRILPLAEETVRTLEARGYRRAVIRKSAYPGLTQDVLTIDFSGWTIFTREDAPDDLVRQICAALVARKHLLPWDGQGDLPIERMAREAPDTPQLVPLHRAAEAFWRDKGWL